MIFVGRIKSPTLFCRLQREILIILFFASSKLRLKAALTICNKSHALYKKVFYRFFPLEKNSIDSIKCAICSEKISLFPVKELKLVLL